MEEQDVVELKAEVKQKILEHADQAYAKGKKEALGFLFGNFDKNIVMIDDIAIPKQIATNISVKETENDIEIVKKIREFDEKLVKKVHVGWYHSHPGMGCFLSGVDEETQKYWQLINERMVAVVIDNLRKEIEAFRVKIKANITSQYKIKIRIIE